MEQSREELNKKIKKYGFYAFNKNFTENGMGLIIFDEDDKSDKNINVMGNRAVGVVYNPTRDDRQFEPTIVTLRYDALFFFKKTTALRVLKK